MELKLSKAIREIVNTMSEKVKKEDIKTAELNDNCLEQVSGGDGDIFCNNVVGKNEKEKINKSGPEDHWFED